MGEQAEERRAGMPETQRPTVASASAMTPEPNTAISPVFKSARAHSPEVSRRNDTAARPQVVVCQRASPER